MSNIAIRAEQLSKLYKIGRTQRRHDTLRDQITDGFKSLFKRNGRAASADNEETIWALKDVSLEVKRGEILGIVGRNGAGKSTLLKILSRIVEPTGGRAELHGRVGSLLEVGTGFHGDLTGRENTYLNGAILGMRKSEIDRKFDEIIAFAEIEKFIDTPVKRYSSGMYMRLAFSVAAHLEPEILVVDEVLAVGDVAFQKKCLGKMGNVARDGRTVLFVSHNLPAVVRLCERAILLNKGKIVLDGPTHKIVSNYLSSGLSTNATKEWVDRDNAPGGEVARLRAVRVRNKNGCTTDMLDIRESVVIEMEYDVLKPGYMFMPNFQLYNDHGVHIFSAHDLDPAWRRRKRPIGRYISAVEIPGNFLSDGQMFIGAGLQTIDPVIHQFYELDAVSFQVIDNMDTDSARGDYEGEMRAVIRPRLDWHTKYIPGDDGFTTSI
jgi:lipopolysaccharide transport system ATP-binding protein